MAVFFLLFHDDGRAAEVAPLPTDTPLEVGPVA
jgi:hypothetical protein